MTDAVPRGTGPDPDRQGLAKVLEPRAGEGTARALALWVEVSGTADGAYTYDMYFQAAAMPVPTPGPGRRTG